MSEVKSKLLVPGDQIKTGRSETQIIKLMEAPQEEICCRMCHNGGGNWHSGRVYCDFDGARSGYIDGDKCVCRVYTPHKGRINDTFSQRRFSKINKIYERILRPEIYLFEVELEHIMKNLRGKHYVSIEKFARSVNKIFWSEWMKNIEKNNPGVQK